MMPDLGKYAVTVLSAYGASFLLLVGLVAWSLWQAARVKRVFGAPLLDYYGQTERSCAAYSLEDGVYRFIFPYAYPELIPGADGRCSIVGTPFWNRSWKQGALVAAWFAANPVIFSAPEDDSSWATRSFS